MIFLVYRFYGLGGNMRPMTERHSRSLIRYTPKKMMKEMYPNGGYEIIGEINNGLTKYTEQDSIMTEEGKQIPIFPRGSSVYPIEWPVGYARIGESSYVTVIKSMIPFWVHNV